MYTPLPASTLTSTPPTLTHPLASTLLPAFTYNANKLSVLASQTTLLARELFSEVVRTYSTLYSTLNPTYTPVYAFSVAAQYPH